MDQKIPFLVNKYRVC